MLHSVARILAVSESIQLREKKWLVENERLGFWADGR
jgi:hypothetical protein